MRAITIALPCLLLTLIALARDASAAETCGDGLDNDTDGLADEGCWPAAVTGVCENPLSCGLTGSIAPKLGAVVYAMAADLAPRVAYGPELTFQRTYMSHYEPGTSAPAYRKPFSKIWHHNWMSWLDKNTSPDPDQVIVHLPSGQDVLFEFDTTSGGFDYYTPQIGAHYDYLRQATSSPYQWELRTLQGWVYVYDWSSPTGKLIEVHDSLATPNVVTLSYDGSGRLQYVTDAQGARRLEFAYNASSYLVNVYYKTISGGTATTRAYWQYVYNNNLMTAAESQGGTTQKYTYSGGHLTLIEDDANNDVISFAHLTGTAPASAVRVATSYGEIGIEYDSSRESCDGGTIVFFNRSGTATCDEDSDCGSGLLCGGETNPASANTGVCYRAARCLQLSSPSEDLVTTVTSVGPPSESCEGACTEIAEYAWDTSSVLNLLGIKDPGDNWTSYAYDGNGLPITIVYADTDDDATNGGGARTLELYYDDSSFPGLVSESRRQSDLSTSACTRSTSTGCQRTLFTYNSNGLLSSRQELGFTLDSSNAVTAYSYTANYSYDSQGRLTQVDGALSGSNDVTDYTYWSSSDVFKNGQLKEIKRKKDSTNYLVTTLDGHDHWGNPTSIQVPDGTFTCLTFHSHRNYLTQRREAMNGQSSCTTSHSSDLVTIYTRDQWLQLTKVEHPAGGCTIHEYDTRARLVRTKLRDDCNASSSGENQEFTYNDDGLLIETEILDASSTVTRRQEQTYSDSRRLEKLINPVATSTHTLLSYDTRGLVTTIEAPSGLSKTERVYDDDDRLVTVKRYTGASTFDSWELVKDWLDVLSSVTDDDSKEIEDRHDDMGRQVETVTPDSGTTLRTYNADGALASVIEAYGVSGTQTHSYTSDNLGRTLTIDYHGSCGSGAPVETSYSYDTLPSGVTCPYQAQCARTAGRLAYVRTTLLCIDDSALNQETFYSYDHAGRVEVEHIQDDTGRTGRWLYSWRKNGSLESMQLPSGVTMNWEFGTTADNSDQDTIVRAYRESDVIVENVSWFPFGPLKSYRHTNEIDGNYLQTVFSRNLAYRVSNVRVEQITGTLVFQAAITEDDNSRVIGRDFSGGHEDLQDSYFLYDKLDRVTCETDSSVSSCPSSQCSGGEPPCIKNSHDASPPFTASNDWKQFKRPIPGSPTVDHTAELIEGTDQIAKISQSIPYELGDTEYVYDVRGNRILDDNTYSMTYDARSYTYDGRRNVTTIAGKYKVDTTWHDYVVTNAYDERNRRVFKSFFDAETEQQSHWFFYYDPLDRLTEIRWTPDIQDEDTYSLYQVSWIGARPVHIWETNLPSETTSRAYIHTDETTRPLEMYDWPDDGDASRVWATNPDAWGNDSCLTGCANFQPFVFPGQYRDVETVAWRNDGTTQHRPSLILTWFRGYDPFVGAFMQVAKRVGVTWDPYTFEDNNPVASEVCHLEWVQYECSGPAQAKGTSDDPEPTETPPTTVYICEEQVEVCEEEPDLPNPPPPPPPEPTDPEPPPPPRPPTDCKFFGSRFHPDCARGFPNLNRNPPGPPPPPRPRPGRIIRIERPTINSAWCQVCLAACEDEGEWVEIPGGGGTLEWLSKTEECRRGCVTAGRCPPL